jgi:hypothetical protein
VQIRDIPRGAKSLPITFDAGKTKSVTVWSHEGKVFLEVESADDQIIVSVEPRMARAMGTALRKLADVAGRARRQ